MGFFLKLVSLILGGGSTVNAIIEGLTKANYDRLNATTESTRIEAQSRIDTLNAMLSDVQNARMAAKNQPWWMALLAFMFGSGFALHSFLVCVGTSFAPLIIGGTFDWLLHIPKLPSPYDSMEMQIIMFFYGYGALTIGSNATARAIINRRK